MDKKMKRGILISCVILLVFGLLALCYFVWQIPLFDRSGWCTSNSGEQMYLDYYGKPSVGWVELDGKWYYFDDQTCAMQTGWQTIGEYQYLLKPDGSAITGWYAGEEDWYYFNPQTCAMQTGWVSDDGFWYFMDQEGKMQTGWLEEEGNKYYLGEDGRASSGWEEIEGKRYYFDPVSAAMQTGWIVVDGNYYYMKSSGAMNTGWLKSGDSYYYLSDEDGSMQTGWLETEKGTYYLDEEGRRQVSWAEIDGQRYFFNVDGKMRTGWLHTGDGSFYLTESGAAYTGWMTTSKSRYYMLEDGKMATGFVTVDGIERYFLKSGDYIPLVNRENTVPEDFVPVLVEVEGYMVDETCRDALIELMEAARAAGRTIEISSAYRDEEKQVAVWEEYREGYMAEGYTYEEAEELTAKYVAVPGTSEHHLGLAIDFYNRGDIYEWLAENSWRYGFILRYIGDDGKVAYEPWHFRYVGKEMAKSVYDSRLILEKYLESVK